MRDPLVALLFLVVLTNEGCKAFIGGTNLVATRKRTSSHRINIKTRTSRVRATAGNDQDEDNNHDQNDITEHQQHDDGFSKSKWKKKRYIMMHDVDQRIQRGNANAATKAQEMVHRMNHLYETTRHVECKPTVQAYNSWINALAKSKQVNAGKAAEDVLKEMKRNGVQPNVISFTSVIDAYAKSGNRGRKRSKQDKNAAQEAERVLFDLLQEQLVDPSICISSVTCDAVLNAWAQQSTFEAAERAQAILDRMEHLQNQDIKPTAHSYSTVMNGWAKCRHGQAAERAEALLNKMLTQATVEPDTVVFNGVIHAWANCGDARAGTRAVALLHQMQELHSKRNFPTAPDVITYNSVICAWSHCGHVNAAKQAERVLQQMQKASNQSPTAPKPNTVSYNTVLDSWSKSSLEGAAQRAQTVLEYMIAANKAGKNNIAPDVISFTSVLNAWAKSKHPDKAVKARELLDKMLDLWQNTQDKSLQPTVIPFNTVLNACAFSAMGTTPKQQRQALQVAVNTFTQLRKMPERLKLGPDSLSYGNMIKCCANLMPQGNVRNEMAKQLFTKCCQDGMVGDLVWDEMKRAVPNRVITQDILDKQAPKIAAFSVSSIRVRDLPRSWSRNSITRRKRPVKKRPEKKEKPSAKKSAPLRHVPQITESSWQAGQM